MWAIYDKNTTQHELSASGKNEIDGDININCNSAEYIPPRPKPNKHVMPVAIALDASPQTLKQLFSTDIAPIIKIKHFLHESKLILI